MSLFNKGSLDRAFWNWILVAGGCLLLWLSFLLLSIAFFPFSSVSLPMVRGVLYCLGLCFSAFSSIFSSSFSLALM